MRGRLAILLFVVLSGPWCGLPKADFLPLPTAHPTTVHYLSW